MELHLTAPSTCGTESQGDSPPCWGVGETRVQEEMPRPHLCAQEKTPTCPTAAGSKGRQVYALAPTVGWQSCSTLTLFVTRPAPALGQADLYFAWLPSPPEEGR